MPYYKRHKTDYQGVYYINVISEENSFKKKHSISPVKNNPEKITDIVYYICYRKDGKQIEERVGSRFKDNMSPAKASHIRSLKYRKIQLSNKELKQVNEAKKQLEQNRYTIERLWQEFTPVNSLLKSSIQNENRYKNYILPNFGHKVPSELNPFEIDRLKITLLKTRKPQSVKHILTLLQRIINFGVNKQLCEGIKFKIVMPKVDNIKTEDLTPEQLQRLFQALNEDPNIQVANLMKLALYTGMRRGELFRLRWEDINFNRGFINILNPKGGKNQTIPLNNEARNLLLSHPHTEGSPFIFPGRDGGLRKEIIKQANHIKERAGLPKDFRALHGLRHVFASLIASSGQVDLYTLQKLLTHKSPQMVIRYAHLRDETLKKASNLVCDLIQQSISESSNIKDISK